MEKHWRVVPRGVAPRHRLPDLPDLEQLSRPLRRSRHRQHRDRQAASRRDPAAGPHRARRARRPGRGRGCRPTWCCSPPTQPAPITQALVPPPDGGDRSTTPARNAFGDWLRAQRRRGAGLHRGGGRQLDRHRRHGRLRRPCARNVAFSLALYSGQMCTAPQDIFVPRGRHRHRRRAPRLRRRSRGAGAGGRRSCCPTRRARSRSSVRCRTTACCSASTRPGPSDRWSSTAGRSSTRSIPRP